MLDRREEFKQHFDHWRQAICCEPRGSDWMVGALITPPVQSDSHCGVIFFNNVGYLNMCGHGTIGVAVALADAGRVSTGRYAIDTPVGQVWFENLGNGFVRIQNVPSYRYRNNVQLTLHDGMQVQGDIAWGGNWFFLAAIQEPEICIRNLNHLHQLASSIRRQLILDNVTGADGADIDHVEIVGAPSNPQVAHARNYVLCPGGAYDRSPCGTGTSAKVACLAADGKLAVGQKWVQESVIGSRFEATYELCDPNESNHASGEGLSGPTVRVSLVGSAYVNARSELVLDPNDPFCMGIPQ